MNTRPSIKKAFSEKNAHALYLSYATLVRYVAFVNDMIFQLPRRHIFGSLQAACPNNTQVFSFCAKSSKKMCAR